MSDVQKQFKKLDQKALKLQLQCEKNSQYIETEKSKSFLRTILFLICTLMCGASVFIIINTSLETSFKSYFKSDFTPAVIISFFIVAGITSVFYMNRKFTGIVILMLALINMTLAMTFYMDSKALNDNLIKILLCIFLIILSLITLIKAYRIKRHK